MTRNKRQATGRRGYTLMEMLLVQGVIVALVAMSWPALRGSLDKNRLQAAARQVRTELVQARLKAAETGVAQQFCYQAGDHGYEVTAASATGAASSASSHTSISAALDEQDQSEDCEARILKLDQEVRFADAADFQSEDSTELEEPAPASSTAGLNELGRDNWSAPIVFLPNGRSSNARVRLIGPRGYHVDVILRGLTGAVTVAELVRDEETE